MHPTRCETVSFPFFELPAELRNNIYGFTIADETEIRRLVPRPQYSNQSVVQEPLLPLANISKRLRAEFLSYYFGSLRAGLQITDLEQFRHTFCRNIYDGPVIRLQRPKAIIIYVSGFPAKDQRWFHPPINILPLLKLRLECPTLSCTFEADPKVDWQRCPPPPGTVRGRTVLDGVAARCRGLTSFLNCNNEKWLSLVQANKLAMVLVHPWLPTNIDLVFKEQPLGRRIDEASVRCYLPDTRRFGLDDVYLTTNLEMKMSLEI